MDSSWVFAVAAVLYVYGSFSLMTIARKTGTPGEWMAWLPIANLVLMCRCAGRSAGWVVGLLIPFVNLVVMVKLCGALARARGKSESIRWLVLIPGPNLLVPGVLAAGPAMGGATASPAYASLAPAHAAPQFTAPQFAAPHAASGATPTGAGSYNGLPAAIIVGVVLAFVARFGYAALDPLLPAWASRKVVSGGSAFTGAFFVALVLASRSASSTGPASSPIFPSPPASPQPQRAPARPASAPPNAPLNAPARPARGLPEFSLSLGNRRIRLAAGVKLLTTDLAGLQPEGGGSVVAEANPNPNDPTVLGLLNRSRRAWTATMPDGSQRVIPTGKTVRLAAGTRIDFGAVTGQVS